MKRLIEKKLIEWKNKTKRKPLLIMGARQVGKTYIMKSFGDKEYKNVIYLNFEKDINLKELFEGDLSPESIVYKLELNFGEIIDIQDSLFIFDEIQNAPRALTSLKYFNESEIEYNIMAAGSTLGVYMNKQAFSFPVGQVEIIEMHPMDFEEFLMSLGRKDLIELIYECTISMLPCPVHNKILEIYKEYLFIGGYPEAVANYITHKNIVKFDNSILSGISSSYRADITNYTERKEAIRVLEIFLNIPQQLAKENKKFKYSNIKKNAISRDYKYSVSWLVASKIVHKVPLVEYPIHPLMANAKPDLFKLYYIDTGLISNTIEVEPATIILGNKDFTYMGAITENYIVNSLISKGFSLYYWRKSPYEVDLLIEKDGEVFPIEVKTGKGTKSISLNQYTDKYSPLFSIRFSSKNFGFENNIKSIPLYAAFAIEKLFE